MKHNFMAKMVSALLAVVLSTAAFCINENHSLGEWFKKSLLAIMQKKKLLLLYNQEAVWQLQQGTTKGGHSNERHE